MAKKQGEVSHTQKAGQTVEVGVSGVKISSGYVVDEFITNLQGDRGRKKYREMMDNDPTIGALLTAIEMILRAVDFKFEAAPSDLDSRFVEFAESQFETMTTDWNDVLSEILTFLPFGFSLMEMVFARDENGFITTSKIAPRYQETIQEWEIDERGDIDAIVQWPPFGGGAITIPYNHLLHFKTKMQHGNPEGKSILRNAYRSFHFIKNISMIESIAIERELVGLPVVKIPAAAMKDAAVLAKYEKMVRDVKFNEQGGIVMPSNPYIDENGAPTSTPQYEFTLMSASGSRSIDTDTVIKRHQHDIVRSVLADFIMLGSGDSGSFALSKSKTDLFLRSIEGYLKVITKELNDKWMTTLWDLNGFNRESMPKLTTGRVAPVDLAELGSFMRDSGLMATMDRETEDFVRDVSGLPKLGDGDTL